MSTKHENENAAVGRIHGGVAKEQGESLFCSTDDAVRRRPGVLAHPE